MTNEIPFAPIKRIMKQYGAERVSNDAIEPIVKAVEEYISELTISAVKLAKYNGRKTVKKSDIEYVL